MPDETINTEGAFAAEPARNGAEVLAFRLGNEEFGVDIHEVRELRGYTAVTRIAEAPPHWKGVVNLRSVIVPIVDLRIKLGLGQPVYGESTVVIVLDLEGRQIGVVVDSVSDVVSIPAEQIKAPPPSGPNFRHDYLTGIATIDERLLQLVNLNLLLADTASAAVLPHAA